MIHCYDILCPCELLWFNDSRTQTVQYTAIRPPPFPPPPHTHTHKNSSIKLLTAGTMFLCLRTASTVSFSKQIRVTVKAAAVEKELIYSRPATAPTPVLAALQPSPPFHSSGHKDCQT